MQYIVVALINYILIGAKAAQQLNVVHDNYRLVPVVGLVLAAGEVIVYGSVAITAVSGSHIEAVLLILSMWVGGFLGTFTSMKFHKKFARNEG